MTDQDNPITEENVDKLKRMQEYLELAIKNGDTAYINNGNQVVIDFYRYKKKPDKP